MIANTWDIWSKREGEMSHTARELFDEGDAVIPIIHP